MQLGRLTTEAVLARRSAVALMSGLVLAVCAVLLNGCSAGQARSATSDADPGTRLPAGSTSHSITVDGVARTFLIHKPPSLSGAVPLVVMIHGGGGSAVGAERSYGWDAEANSGHFVVAYPDGLDRGWSVGGGCCRKQDLNDPDSDVKFITAVVHFVSGEIPIDSARIYATGISEGGMMAYRLACQSTVFAAIGPDSATSLGGCPSAAATSVIHIHGTADQRIPYDGTVGAGVHHIQGPSVPALNAFWRSIDHCAAPTVSVTGDVTVSTATCPAGRGVELITITGAGHQWPGASCNRRCFDGIADRPFTALQATPTMWRFFAAHPKPGAAPRDS